MGIEAAKVGLAQLHQDHFVQRVEVLVTPVSSWIHPLFILPDTGFHQTLNQRLTPHVVGHGFLQFLFTGQLIRKDGLR